MNLQELGIPEFYTFKIIVLNLKAIKSKYTGILSLFLPFDSHNKVLRMKEIHDLLYSLNLDTWKIDRIWEYLNGDIEYEFLENLVNRQKTK